MNNDLVCRSNVIFELYKAALKNEISQDEFRRAKAIVERAKAVQRKEPVREED